MLGKRTAAAAACAATLLLSLSSPAAASPPPNQGNGSPSIAANAPWTSTVTWLVGQLSVDEKLRLVRGGTDPDQHGEAGIILGVPRLGIPDIRQADAQGVNVYKDATAYPTRLGLAASFDRDAITRFGQSVGTEGRALDVDLIYGPQVDLARMPTWARNMTTYGEDPYLAAQLTGREINALQSTGLMSQVKHFTIYNGQDQNTPSVVTDQTAHELYLQPSEAAVKDGKVTSVMCSYAKFQITGVDEQPDYACSNSGALNGILRDQWNFKGWVTSDYFAAKATSDLLAGMDQEFVTSYLAPAALKPLVDPASATYDKAYAGALDRSVARILYQYQRFGLLDDSTYPRSAKSDVRRISSAPAAVNKQAGIATSRELADEAGVLLKNDGALPLRDDQSVALIGPTADLLPSSPGGERSRGFGDRNSISPYDAVRSIAGTRATLTPGIDRIGTTVTALTTAGGAPGLTRTAKDASGKVIGTKVDSALDGRQTGLVRGNSYTWDGDLNVTTEDDYWLWLQRPIGTSSGNPSAYNGGINPGLAQGAGTGATGTATLSVDGADQTLTQPSTVLPNTYPGGPTVNGQYLGLTNVGVKVHLTPGRHKISLGYAPAADTAATPTVRFSWAGVQAGIKAAATAATKAKTAVVFVDDANTTTTPGNVGTLGADQDRLIQTVAAANPDTVVVLNTGGAVQMPWLSKVKSVLEMWYPGQEGGTATADLLYGKADPAGRLPVTFPTGDDATPFAGHPERSTGQNGQITWSEGLDMGYRWYADTKVAPQFAFGHGLSYTTYAYSNLRVQPTGNGDLNVRVTVRNTGRRAGAAVPQIYVGPSRNLPASIQQVSRKLVQFDRVQLQPGESRTVHLTVAARDLSSWSTSGQTWVLGTGTRTVYAGDSATDLPLSTTVTIR